MARKKNIRGGAKSSKAAKSSPKRKPAQDAEKAPKR
jgi:hypothetical protein